MDLYKSDPEYMAIIDAFAGDEVINEEGQSLPPRTRYLVILATLLGCQGEELFRLKAAEALEGALTPVELREVVYQATDYLGLGRVYHFVKAMDVVFEEKGISLPLPPQGTTTREDRLEKGAKAQAEIFGEQMLDFWKKGHMNRYLAANCFGDYYTRNGLDLKDRELITFCFLLSQGGCEPQLTSHAKGNMNMGNDSALLVKAVTQALPYIGYPRSLNAIACITKASELK